ncbi:MAG TPA: methyltransferase domain-containing protein [Motilibacteraceae bacterium]|nr:methyltransferase domain-containing protein [Motilibacteraceae bacterium]
MAAADRWCDELAAWAIDPDILAAAPESPYALAPGQFRAADRGAYDPGPVPSRERAREALEEGGSVLDVGCGAGAAALALAPPAARLTGVDEQADMLAAFEVAGHERGIAVSTVQGRWPDVAQQVERAAVVVCHHVLYNVSEIEPFLLALQDHAQRRVVIELTATHPWTPVGPLWQRAHGQPRPDGPTADLAVQVLRELGIEPHVEPFQRTARARPWEEEVASMRRRLCLPAERDEEVGRWMRELGVLHSDQARREVVAIWWDC